MYDEPYREGTILGAESTEVSLKRGHVMENLVKSSFFNACLCLARQVNHLLESRAQVYSVCHKANQPKWLQP
jgi:hypothetical protein